MNVVILSDFARINGGAAAVALNSALGLAARGIHVTLFAAVGPVARELIDIPNLEVICLDQQEIIADPQRLQAFRRGIWNVPAAAELTRLLSRCDPSETVVHAHSWMKALSPLVLSAAVRAGFKLVITLHDFFITCPSGGFFVHRTEQLCFRKPLSLSCLTCQCDRRSYAHKLWRSARTFVQNHLLDVPARANEFIAVSDHSARVMRPYLPARTPITLIRNPVDCLDQGPAPVEANQPFAFIGRFEKEKGVLLFAEAVQKLGVPALFIGDGELGSEAQKLCPHAVFTGWLPLPEAVKALRGARALVFPPLWFETLGLVVVEAAALGLPAIVASECAATDFIIDGANGLWFDHGSLASLCQQMSRLTDQPGLASQLGRNAYHWYWSDPWTTDRHVDSLLPCYERQLARFAAAA